jgi:predicted alpha/beta hydrolase family esterase
MYNQNMKTAILIHGYNDKSEYEDTFRPTPSNDHWFPWVQKQLTLKGILTQAPEMPGFYEPNYEKWKEMLEGFKPDGNTALVGHSCGGGFLVRWLSENDVKVGKVVLVAPWLNPEKEAKIDPNFFNFEIDSNIAQKTAGLTVMYSADDFSDILETINILKSKLIGANFQEFPDKGHFVLDSMKTEAFPELLEVLIN